MGDIKPQAVNIVMVSYCPICKREMLWLPFEPVNFPGADYVAFCINCNKEFGVAITNKQKKED